MALHFVKLSTCMYPSVLEFKSMYPHIQEPGYEAMSMYLVENSITMKRRLSVTNLSSENNLPTFRLDAPVVIREKDDWNIQSKRRQVIF